MYIGEVVPAAAWRAEIPRVPERHSKGPTTVLNVIETLKSDKISSRVLLFKKPSVWS